MILCPETLVPCRIPLFAAKCENQTLRHVLLVTKLVCFWTYASTFISLFCSLYEWKFLQKGECLLKDCKNPIFEFSRHYSISETSRRLQI